MKNLVMRYRRFTETSERVTAKLMILFGFFWLGSMSVATVLSIKNHLESGATQEGILQWMLVSHLFKQIPGAVMIFFGFVKLNHLNRYPTVT